MSALKGEIMSPMTYSGASWRRSASRPTGAISGVDAAAAISSTSKVCWATEKACVPIVCPFQRATRASPWAMSSISTSSGEGSRRSSRRPTASAARHGEAASVARYSSPEAVAPIEASPMPGFPARRRLAGLEHRAARPEPRGRGRAGPGRAPRCRRSSRACRRACRRRGSRAGGGKGGVAANLARPAAAPSRDAPCARPPPVRRSSPSEFDAAELVHVGIVRECVAESEVDSALGDAERDAVRVVARARDPR